ncbi:MAG: lysophospholipid acyltransferase family protein [Myxococcota bacterium]
MRPLRILVAYLAAAGVFLLRCSCRIRWHDDPRKQLREEGHPYAYAILHCHQIAAIVAREPGTGAMVSRSADGDLLIPTLRANGIVPIRGSSRRGESEKGGAAALSRLIRHVRGGHPAYLAVDGPRGPRNHVQPGIAKLSQETGAAVLIAAPIPRRRWILQKTWDRFQIPKPFSSLDMYFGEPLYPKAGAREGLDAFRERIEDALTALEATHDSEEAAEGTLAAQRRRARLRVEGPANLS